MFILCRDTYRSLGYLLVERQNRHVHAQSNDFTYDIGHTMHTLYTP